MKLAVVTGGAGAISSAICSRLVELGYRVLAVDVDRAGMDRLPGVVGVVADLTSPTFHDEVLAAVAAHGGQCDLLVNNAGIVVTGPIEFTDPAMIGREQLVNLHAPMLLTHALLPLLRESRGQIITVASLGSMMPLAECPGYCASKAGLRAFMLSLSMREKETGVRISLVHPAAVDTPMLKYEVTHGGSALNFLSEPLQPADVARAVINNIKRPRLETSVPWHSGLAVKMVGLVPSVLRPLRPLLERAGKSGMDKHRAQLGLD